VREPEPIACPPSLARMMPRICHEQRRGFLSVTLPITTPSDFIGMKRKVAADLRAGRHQAANCQPSALARDAGSAMLAPHTPGATLVQLLRHERGLVQARVFQKDCGDCSESSAPRRRRTRLAFSRASKTAPSTRRSTARARSNASSAVLRRPGALGGTTRISGCPCSVTSSSNWRTVGLDPQARCPPPLRRRVPTGVQPIGRRNTIAASNFSTRPHSQ
jgi:hypothetical protein